MSETEEGNNIKGYDPGWNDPPMFSYDSRPAPAPGKKPSLTKRVGLSWDSSVPAPVSSGATMDEPILPASAPPRGPILPARAPPRGPIVGPPPLKGPSITTSHARAANTVPPPEASSATLPTPPLPSAPPFEEESDSQSPGAKTCPDVATSGLNLKSVSSALNEVAEQLFVDKERERAEIVKRLSLLETLWKEGKFPDDVKEKLLSISSALKNDDADEADKLQRGLMVDHSAVCSSWMAAIRKMISSVRQTPSTSS